MTARILLIGAFLYFAALFGGLYVKLHAQEKCTPVDPAAMVWTGHGFSIAMGDGHLWINREDVVYAEVSQPHVCMPAKGMMQLLLPHAWPSYAGRDGAASASFRVAAPHPQMGVKQPSAATSRIILAQQKLASDGYPTFREGWIAPAHQKLISDAWIDRSTNKKGERCCDSGKDCHSIEPERVKPAEGGVVVQLDDRSVFVPGGQIMVSEDGKFWVCYWGGQVKCFFAPYSGS